MWRRFVQCFVDHHCPEHLETESRYKCPRESSFQKLGLQCPIELKCYPCVPSRDTVPVVAFNDRRVTIVAKAVENKSLRSTVRIKSSLTAA